MFTMFHKENLKDFLAIASFTLFILYAFRDLINIGMLAWADFPPFPESVQQGIDLFISSWQPLSLGLHVSMIDFSILFKTGLVLLFAGNASLAQKFYIIFPAIAAFVAMYWFLASLVKSRIARYISAFFYVVNPITTCLLIGGVVGFWYIQAIFPILVYMLLGMAGFKNKRGNKSRYALLFSFLLCIGIGVAFVSIIVYISLYVLYGLFLALKDRSALLEYSKALLLASIPVILFIFITYYSWIPHLTKYIVPVAGERYTPTIGMTYSYFDSLSPLLNMITAQTFGLGKEFGWGTDPFILISSLSIPILSFSSLVFKRARRNSFAVFNALIATLVISFIYLTYLGKTTWLFETFGFLALFPNPDPVSVLLVFAYAPLIAITVDQIKEKSDIRFFRKLLFYVTISAILISLLTLNWPILTGDMGFSLTHRGKDVVPSEFYEIASQMQKERERDPFFRTLWLPSAHTEVATKIKYLDPYTLTLPMGLEKMYSYPFADHLNSILRQTFCEENYALMKIGRHNDSLGTFLAPYGVKYIIVNNRSQYTGRPVIERPPSIYTTGEPKYYSEMLSQQKDLEIVETKPGYEIYKNLQYIPHVAAAFPKAIYVDSFQNISDADTRYVTGLLSTIPTFTTRDNLLIFADDVSPFETETISERSDLHLILASEADTSVKDSNALLIYPIDTLIPQLAASKALSFDGIDDYVEVPHSESLDIMDEITMEFWMKPAIDASAQGAVIYLLGKRDHFVIDYDRRLERLEIFIAGSTPSALGYRTDFMAGKWYHIAGVYSKTAGVRSLYINGVEVKMEKDVTGFASSTNPVTIGSFLGTSYFFNGVIDEARIYNRALSDTDIVSRYKGEDIQTGLVLELKMNENAGTLVNDSSGTNNGDIYGATWTKGIHTYSPSSLRVPGLDFSSSGFYKIAFRFKSESKFPPVVMIDEKSINYRRMENDWLESDSVQLTQGTHNITIAMYKHSDLISGILIFPVMNANLSLTDTFSSPRESLHINSSGSLTEYFLDVNVTRPTFIFLGEPYHKEWNAYLVDGGHAEELVHFLAFRYMNGYLLEQYGTHRIKISFIGQRTRELTIYSWVLLWFFQLSAIALTYIPKKLKIRLSLRLPKLDHGVNL